MLLLLGIMLNDLTLLYYTANTIEEFLGENIRQHLLKVNEGKYPIVSISQKPLNFGENICVGEIGKSYYNCYKQIFIGAKEVKTEYIAMCEDDTLYSQEHFSHRPSNKKVFSYNKNMWYTEETEYWSKGWVGMCTCVVTTRYLIDMLKPRFEKFPKEDKSISKRVFQEPGRFDGANIEYWYSKIPILTFNYFGGLGGKAKSVAHPPASRQILDPYGDCWELKKKFWGRAKPKEQCKPRYGHA